ncbi:GNAT family N-acetyltransferase [Fictibacillus nanhaiensis]|uniref:GNAT family N-acetyltransferase n=1 Tax=Fictibacillus nanhaiensis TaxID=742169 RepID=UPI001C95256F|nr:GNAT family N-acetyltransferase [Fictibacillus nanhaiensis]
MQITLQISRSLQGEHREALYPLFEQVFGIPTSMLEDYYSRGFWNPDYCPYTLFKEKQAVANVSVIPMKWMMGGKIVIAAGIQSVMTLPSERGQGHMTRLMRHVLHDLKDNYSHVFLQTENPALYKKYGFVNVEEHIFISNAIKNNKVRECTLRKLDYQKEEDLKVIQSCFLKQYPNSYIFTPLSYQHSFYLNLYNPYLAEKLYYSDSLDLLLVYLVEDGILKLFDVIGKKRISLHDICEQIPELFTEVEIYFTPDQLTHSYPLQYKKKEGTLMVKGELPFDQGPVAYPFTASF